MTSDGNHYIEAVQRTELYDYNFNVLTVAGLAALFAKIAEHHGDNAHKLRVTNVNVEIRRDPTDGARASVTLTDMKD